MRILIIRELLKSDRMMRGISGSHPGLLSPGLSDRLPVAVEIIMRLFQEADLAIPKYFSPNRVMHMLIIILL